MLVYEYGGEPREFRLTLGHIVDLEKVRGNVGLGAIYMRIAQNQYHIRDLYDVIRLALVGGGMSEKEARAMVDDRFDILPVQVHYGLALEILIDLLSGAQATDDGPKGDGDIDKPIDWGGLILQMVQAGLSPDQVRAWSLSDYQALMRAAGRKDSDKAPSEEEFEAMLARVEQHYPKGDTSDGS